MSILLQVAPVIPKLPFWEVAGAAGLVVMLLWIIYLFVTKIFVARKKDVIQTQFETMLGSLQEVKKTMHEIDVRSQETRRNLDVFKAHYKSEDRFKTQIEQRIDKMEKVIHGNGQQSLITKVELIEKDIENFGKDIDNLCQTKNVKKRTT